MTNPYAAPQTESEKTPIEKSRWRIITFCLTAYSLHVLALWGIACFHDAHVGSELKQPFNAISATFGWVGLLGVAMVYAMVPTVAYGVCFLTISQFAKTTSTWSKVLSIAQWSLVPGLVVDGILGLPLFTKG